MVVMKPPIFVRTLTPQEHQQLKAGLRSQEAFVLKRCQILLASAQGQTVLQVAQSFGYAPNTIRHVLHAFNREGLAALTRKSNRPKSTQPLLNAEKRQQLRHLLEQSPRAFGKARSTWTLPLLAQAAQEQGLTERTLDADTLGVAIKRLGLNWRRAQQRMASPDPGYGRKKSGATR
jgi:transposase